MAHLNQSRVEYVVIGGHAVVFHGVPREPGDVDVLVRPSAENGKRLAAALIAHGYPDLAALTGEMLQPARMTEVGVWPHRLHIIGSIVGVDLDEVFRTSVGGEIAGQPVQLIGREALIANKRATGRPRDAEDAEGLAI